MNIADIVAAQQIEADALAEEGVEKPRPAILDFDITNNILLSRRLFVMASALTAINSRLGELIGQRKAIREAVEVGIHQFVHRAGIKGTVADKEAAAIAESDDLRVAKSILIEYDAKVEMLQGWKDAYDRAWETISRQITIATTEAQLQRR